MLLAAPFTGSTTTGNRYTVGGGTCITAGTGTPPGMVPGCGSGAARDPNGAGALQLTQPLGEQSAFIVTNSAYSTSGGLVITYTDYSFGGTTPSGDGTVMFLSDATRAEPTSAGALGGALGYANSATGPGVANAYVGVALDEYGNFSNPTEGRHGGPGPVPETVAVRGAAASGWQYLTGAKNSSGVPASLPFNIDSPSATVRPANAPTVQVTLTPSGVLGVAIDFHDGNGFLDDIPATNIVGLGGQAAVPTSVHIGFTSATGGATSRHQIGGLTVTTAGGGSVAGSQDNVTYHNNNLRTGWYRNETTLNASNVASSAFHRIATLATGGKSYSQPLYLSAQRVADGSTHNLLIVTDSTDVVYAYDADTFGRVWVRDFKNAGAGIRQQLASDIGCDDTWPNIGINGTPVIDRTRNRMYVVVPTSENGVAHLRLHALALTNGADATTPVEVAGTVPLAGSSGAASVDPKFNFDRAGLLETSNTIYVPLSTHCDFDSDAAHGWMISYNADTLAQQGALVATTDQDLGGFAGVRFLGSVWQGGFGIAADAQSNIYFATGNGPNNGSHDYAMSVLKLPPNLDITKRSFFTPSTWLGESQNDLDLGSGGVMLLPDQPGGAFAHLAIAGGKTGMKYLLNRDNLGGLNATDQIPFETNTAGGMFGGPAYFVDQFGIQKIIYGGTPNLNSYALGFAPSYGLTFTSGTNVGTLENRNAGVTPVVSSNGTQAGSAVVWAIKTPGGDLTGTGTIALYAFDGANLAHRLYSATAGQWTENGDTGGALITPLVANGRVYLATDGQVTVFGTK